MPSPNPSGRPKTSVEVKQKLASHADMALDLQIMAAQITVMRARRALEMLQDPDAYAKLTPSDIDMLGRVIDPVGLAAAQAILDRAFGKAAQKIDDGRKSAFDDMTTAELQEYVISRGGEVVTQIQAERKARRDGGDK